jgi:hypothetical protein
MGIGTAVINEAKGTLEWGFDLTFLGSEENTKKVWKSLGLKENPTKTWSGHIMWSRPGLDIVCTNNPFKEAKQRGPIGKKGYCSYIGIRGKTADVKKAVSLINKYGDPKGESPRYLEFANFSGADEG